MVLRAPAPLPFQDMEFVQFHPTGVYWRRLLITEGARGEGGYLVYAPRGERFPGRAMRPQPKDLASRDVVSRAMTIEIREGRGVGPKKDHIFLHLDHHRSEDSCRAPATAFRRARAHLRRCVDLSREAVPVVPTVHYNVGGIATNYHGEAVINRKAAIPIHVVPGLMALGEAACVSGTEPIGSDRTH